jgi:hypothetical protein
MFTKPCSTEEAMKSTFLSVIMLLLVASPALGALTSGAEDQTGVEITIYNVDLGLVKDQRALRLKKGEQDLRFMGVASRIIPESVSIKSLLGPGSLQVLEQNYEYDLLSPQKLMEKYVGREVKIYHKNPYTDREEVTRATILSTNNGTVLRVGDEITFGYQGRMIFPSVPENLISKPTLVWLIDNTLRGEQKVEATYLTRAINWRADYVLTLAGDDRTADLTGWVTIENRSGAAYRNAALKLVAGDVHRAEEDLERTLMMAEAAPAAKQERFREESFFEYHLYTLKRRTTVKDNQTKQINLLSASGIKIRKELVYHGAAYYYRSRHGEVASNQKVGVHVEIENSKDNNLGMPLPKGTVRVYKRDSGGSLQFIGEDRIDHTPKDEKIRIKVGDAFDVVGARKQTDWRKAGKRTYEAAFEISLRNHKEEDVTVRVIEPIPGDWKMTESSHKYKKTDAHTAEFAIPVPKDGEAVLTYRVRLKF